MKNFLFVLAAYFIILSSCKDDCITGDLDTAIVGRWDVQIYGQYRGEVEFKANGDLVDVDDSFGGGDNKTYTITSNNLLTVRAETASGLSEAVIDITSYDCNKIEFSWGFGVPGQFVRD